MWWVTLINPMGVDNPHRMYLYVYAILLKSRSNKRESLLLNTFSYNPLAATLIHLQPRIFMTVWQSNHANTSHLNPISS